jgi:NDP-sugar pyrophosphorylase family protein
LRNALPYLDPKEPLLVMNGDVVTDLDLRRIWLAHKDRPCLGTLVIHHRSPWNKVAVDGEVIRGFRDKGPGALAFTGISVLDPSLLEWIPPDRPSSLIETFDAVMAARGNALRALRVEGLGRTYVWEDIGTVEGYLAAHARFLSVSANRFLISPNVDVPSDLRLQEWACIGSGAHLGPGVTLRRSVVWEKTEVRADTTLEDSAVTLHGILKIRRLDA